MTLTQSQIESAFRYAVETGKLIHRKQTFADEFMSVCQGIKIDASNHRKQISVAYGKIRNGDKTKIAFPSWCFDLLKEEGLV